MHFDTAPDVDGRVVTAIYYLNDEWAPSDGGELRLLPFPYGPVTVEPIFDRLVFFSSAEMLHHVLPATRERSCLTFWLYSNNKTRPELTRGRPFAAPHNANVDPETLRADAAAMSVLLSRRLRRHFARLALDDIWTESILKVSRL